MISCYSIILINTNISIFVCMYSNSCFSKAGLSLRSVAKDSRRRYGKLVKAIVKIVDQLLLSSKKSDHTSGSSSTTCGVKSISPESIKIAILEESAAKALADVEKAKEKRRETDRKAAAAIEEKIKKDVQKEIVRAQKEEIALLEKKEKASEKEKEKEKEKDKEKEKEKEKKVLTEKELKQAQELKQQRNMFTGFFKSEQKTSSSSSSSSGFSTSSTSSASTSAASACTPSSTSSRAVTSNRNTPGGSASNSSSSSTSSTTSTSATASVTTSSSIICLDGVEIPGTGLESIELRSGVASSGFDVVSFERNLKASISMGEICRTMRERYLSSSF